jgi:hypothetical protein
MRNKIQVTIDRVFCYTYKNQAITLFKPKHSAFYVIAILQQITLVLLMINKVYISEIKKEKAFQSSNY